MKQGFVVPRRGLFDVIKVSACYWAVLAASTASAQVFKLDTWSGFGGDAQHSGMSLAMTANPLKRILWSTPVDLYPQFAGSSLLAHYPPPLVTYEGSVLVTVKAKTEGTFEIQSRNSFSGKLNWTQATDYILPSHGWTPSCGASLKGIYGMVVPGAGGTLVERLRSDRPNSPILRKAFYGIDSYRANQSIYDQAVYICTPLTVDTAGNTYFGFRVTGATPTQLKGGLAKIDADGTGHWISASTASGDSTVLEPQISCAPAISNDGKTVYIAMSRGDNTGGYLVGVDTAQMTRKFSVRLVDPRTKNDAMLSDDSTSSPMVGPDGDVYFGVFESLFFNSRGWLLHFDETLSNIKIPGSFGWDSTPSVVPVSCVPSYRGSSKYLVLTKYNNYVGVGPLGNGVNKIAVLDPNSSTPEVLNGLTESGAYVSTMMPVLSVVGVTPDAQSDLTTYPNAVREWCVNATAIDVRGRCAIVNSEDGHCYRWDFVKNSLTESLPLTGGLGEAYTPTVIGKYGISYAINRGYLFAMGQ